MKQALMGGQLITADEKAEQRGVCPVCGYTVSLRRRTTPAEQTIYYWRHPRNAPRNCPQRTRNWDRSGESTFRGRFPEETADEL